MSVDQTSLDRIRNATFPASRRGYDRREVEKFLNRLADWLETGGGDQSRAELLRRDLERIGQQTGRILTDAHDVAEQLRSEAEREAHRVIEETQEHAAHVIEQAKAEAKRILDEADQRRADAEAVI